MKKILCSIFTLLMVASYSMPALAIQNVSKAPSKVSVNAKKITLAFVFDGPSDKNEKVLKTFQQTIAKQLLPDFNAVFAKDLVFTADWTEQGARKASDAALNSRASMVVSLGYMSSMYLADKKKTKFVVTIDEYGLRDFGSGAMFNPVKQYVNNFILFKKLVPTQKKTAILMSQNYYNLQKNWNTVIDKKLKEKNISMNYVVVPVNHKNLSASLAKIPADVDSVYVTPMFNLTVEQRKELYNYVNGRKLYSFSSVGKEDVQLGAMLGTSTPDVDRKLAEATSFSIHSVLHGKSVKTEKIKFYDNDVIFYNKDTGKLLGYAAPLRLLNNAEVISNAPKTVYDLSYIFNKLEESNLDIARKKFLVSAARRATTAAYLKYLPTLRLDLGHQTYNSDYAKSYSDVPIRAGQFTVGIDQVIYSPDLVTNIIVKHKKLNFDKAEKTLVEQNIGLEVGTMYLDTLILENMIKVQEEYVNEVRENLAISRVREKTGKCGYEEVLRWSGAVSTAEKKLLSMKADYNNIKIHINKLLYKDQKEEFYLKPITAKDPAFYTSDLHVIDHVRTPEKLNKFVDMLVEEVIYLSPETAKLKAAIAMKKAEMSNYAQKFFMPNAKLTYEYTTQFDRDLPYENLGHIALKEAYDLSSQANAAYGTPIVGSPWLNLDKNYGRFMIMAQWKPIEGGQKIAEIARCKAELNELNAYLEQVNTEIEMNVREVVNKAIAKYFIIEKSYKAMFAEAENYKMVKAQYLKGEAPIMQLVDAQNTYTKSKVEALNSQYEFFKELIWVQRGLVSVNWTKPLPEAKKWVESIPGILPAEPDFSL